MRQGVLKFLQKSGGVCRSEVRRPWGCSCVAKQRTAKENISFLIKQIRLLRILFAVCACDFVVHLLRFIDNASGAVLVFPNVVWGFLRPLFGQTLRRIMNERAENHGRHLPETGQWLRLCL